MFKYFDTTVSLTIEETSWMMLNYLRVYDVDDKNKVYFQVTWYNNKTAIYITDRKQMIEI